MCVLVCQTLDNGLNIIQLETAVGAGIKSFEGAVGALSFVSSHGDIRDFIGVHQ